MTVIKQDDTTKNPLAGGIFGLYAGADIKAADGTVVVKKDTLIEKVTTGADGSAVFTADLPLSSSYYVKELQAPENYYRNQNEIYSFTFSYTDDKQSEVEFTHHRPSPADDIWERKQNGHEDSELELRVNKLPGKANKSGGTILVSAPVHPENLTYEQLVTMRHSIRHFSKEPVDGNLLQEAIKLAQYTPSACNRQGWKTRIVADKERIKTILANQNGNRGFGQEFDKLLVVTSDLRAQQKSRELFQAFIDGGMYAESVLNCLYSKGIGSVPLSASLTAEQEKNIRKVVGMDDAEVFILFIGVGNYPKGEFLTTRSERKPIEVEVI